MATAPAASAELFTFRNYNGEEQTIEKKDVVAVVPGLREKTAVIIHVEHHGDDPATPPTVQVSTSGSAPTDVVPKSPTADVDQTHIVVSTGSGANRALHFFTDAVEPVLETLFPTEHAQFSVHKTESATSILELTNDVFLPAANDGVRLRIILLSGDGGIVDLVNGLQAAPASKTYTPPQVVLLPLGTANALYHSIYGSKDNTWGLKALSAQNYAPLPLFTVSFSPGARLLVDEARQEEELPKDSSGAPILHGAVVCSWGMHASLVADSDTTEYRKFGIDRFKMAANEALYPADGSPPHPYKAKVSVLHGKAWKELSADEHMYVMATMVSNLEKTFTISPDSKPLDGSLHLVHFGPTSGDEAMRIMGLAYQGGKHVGDEAVRYEGIDGLRIRFEGKEDDARWRRVCVDGKIVRVEKDGWIEVKKQDRRVLEVAVM